MPVLLCSDINLQRLRALLERYGIEIKIIAEDDAIPGSFWQPPEAGLIGNILYVRPDTPVHSALHESCHYVCMDGIRRDNLDTNAGGDYQEEDAVCYLQILLSDYITEMNQKRMFNDMDKWGYSFRLGSAQAWFNDDAEDALLWLEKNNIVQQQQVTFALRK